MPRISEYSFFFFLPLQSKTMESRYFVQGVSKFENHKEGRHPVNSESQGMPNQTGETGLGLLKHTVSLLPVDFFPQGLNRGWGWKRREVAHSKQLLCSWAASSGPSVSDTHQAS